LKSDIFQVLYLIWSFCCIQGRREEEKKSLSCAFIIRASLLFCFRRQFPDFLNVRVYDLLERIQARRSFTRALARQSWRWISSIHNLFTSHYKYTFYTFLPSLALLYSHEEIYISPCESKIKISINEKERICRRENNLLSVKGRRKSSSRYFHLIIVPSALEIEILGFDFEKNVHFYA